MRAWGCRLSTGLRPSFTLPRFVRCTSASRLPLSFRRRLGLPPAPPRSARSPQFSTPKLVFKPRQYALLRWCVRPRPPSPPILALKLSSRLPPHAPRRLEPLLPWPFLSPKAHYWSLTEVALALHVLLLDFGAGRSWHRVWLGQPICWQDCGSA